MTKISKSFETSRNEDGEFNSLDIEVDYCPEDNTFSLEGVTSYNSRKGTITDLTEIFYSFPDFEKIVFNIDWAEVYAVEMAEREVWDEQ